MHKIWTVYRSPPVPSKPETSPAGDFKPSPGIIVEDGKLPFYPAPQNHIEGLRRCEASKVAKTIAKEGDCGSKAWCLQELWTLDTNQKQYSGFVDCMNDRRTTEDLPLDDRP